MNNNRTKVIVVFFIIIIILILWVNKYSTSNRLLGYYNSDLEHFKNGYDELIILLDNFVESPNIENYSEVQYMIGRTVSRLGSFDRSMAVCYRMGLLRKYKLKYKDSEVTVLVANEIKVSRGIIKGSIKFIENQMILDESKIKLVYENLNTIDGKRQITRCIEKSDKKI